MFPITAPSANPVFYRTYSRRTADGRESWDAVVRRTVDGISELGKLTNEESTLIERMQSELKVLPSGRWLWVGGTDWILKPSNFSGAYNCLAADTEVLTRKGIFKIADLASLEQSTEVLNANGRWVAVRFRSYGKQPVLPVTFTRRGGKTKTVYATPNHAWLTDMGRANSLDLVSGCKIKRISAPKPECDPIGIRHGIIYGDGTQQHGKQFVDLQGEKIGDLLGWFSDVRLNTKRCRVYSEDPGDMKALPVNCEEGYLRGFIIGLLATDGSFCDSTASITGSRETIEYIAKWAPVVGYLVNNVRCLYKAGEASNLCVRKSDVWSINFAASSMSEDDFLRKKHRNCFLERNTASTYWSVKDVGEVESIEVEVFCCEEPTTHAFVLADGLLTGNCTSTNLVDWHAFGLMMDLAMMGSGTGAVIEQHHIDKLPVIANKLNVNISRAIGQVPVGQRHAITTVYSHQRTDGGHLVSIQVGDSRRGWVDAYEALLHLASDKAMGGDVQVHVDLGHVRPAGERLHGFGGVSNPIKLPEMFPRMAAILNGAQCRRLTPIECCLLIDEAALVVVAGNVRRSAGMRQFSCGDNEAAAAKDNLWKQDDSGAWVIDPERDALRMANHTRVYHTRPSYEEVLEAVTKQFYSGEGAIQFAPEAIARGNADVLSSEVARKWFIGLYCSEGADAAANYLEMRKPGMSEQETQHRMQRYGLNPCFAAGTMVMTRKGHFPIESLIGKEVEVHDGSKWVKISNFRVTGQNQKVYNVELYNGQVITATAYHKFILEDGTRVELKDLQPGMRLAPAVTSIQGTIDARAAYLKGFLIGDGTADSNTGVSSCKLYEPKRVCLDRLVASQKEMPMRVMVAANGRTVGDNYDLTNSGYLKNLNHQDSEWMLPWCSVYKYEFPREVLNWTPRCQQEFIAGLFDADGTAMDTTNGYAYQITSVSRSFLQGLGLLLTGLGIRWKIGPVRKGGKKDWGERGGICNAQDTYRLTVPQASSIRLARMVVFERLKSFAERTSTYNIKDNSFKVTSVAYSHTAGEVFCCTVPDTHSFTLTAGVITAQCGEIIGADFHCVDGNTKLIHRDGIDKISSLIKKDVEVWNGTCWSRVSPLLTGRNRKLYRVSLSDGSYLDVTEGHRWFVKDRFQREFKEVTTLELADLLSASKYAVSTEPFKIEYNDGIDVDNAYTLGVLVGDGTTYTNNGKDFKSVVRLHGAKQLLPINTSKQYESITEGKVTTFCSSFDWDGVTLRLLKTSAVAMLSLGSWSRKSILEFVAGLADTDGSNTVSGGIRIYLSDRDRAEAVYLLLMKCGIRSSINLMSQAGAVTNYGTRKQDLYYLQITDCAAIPCHWLDTRSGHSPTMKGKTQVVRSVTELPGLHDTYCFDEPEYHKGVFGGTLTGQCNLAEVHLNQIDPLNGTDQADAFRSAGLAVASLLHHRFDVRRYRISRELDPIVGVSFTGLFDFFVKAFGVPWLEWWAAGRPDTDKGQEFKIREAAFLSHWKRIVHDTITRYCNEHNLKTPNRCTTVQPAGCLDKDALRIFDQGLLCADEIVAPGSGETDSLPLSVRGGVGATTAIANKPMDLVKITFANKRTIRLTPDHRLSVDGTWIRADKMKPGMQVDYSLGEYSRNTDSQLIPVLCENYTRETRALQIGHARGVLTRSITTPTSLTPDLAYLLGALFGNGCLSESKHRIRFVHDDEEIFNRFLQLGEKLFGISATQYKGNGKVRELTFASKQLYDWLHLNGIAKLELSCNLQRIPERVRRSSRQSILAFIAGLIDTDGCPRNGSLSIDLASEAFIRHLQQVGEAVGICFGVSHNTMGENLQKIKSIWSARLSCTRSNPDAMEALNQLSIKLKRRPLQEPKADRGYTPYVITEIVHETGRPDYSYDFAVEGVNDDDSWYWQGALKSHNTKSLLTGASPGWHPPKAQRFIRRITFRKDDPVALACLDYGYSIVPSQSDKDENGRLLDDPFDPRCTEWLVEIPTEVSWADLPGADAVDISGFSALAQFDFYMQVQRHYTAHNTSATIEYRENEIEPLARRIHQAINEDEGYISAALLARFDANATFPRLPFEPIDRATYQRLQADVNARRSSQDFFEALRRYDGGELTEAGPAGCDSDKCLLPNTSPAGTTQNT